MTQTVIDYYYEKSEFGDNLYVEKKQYVENNRQFIQSTVVELDPDDLLVDYYHICNMTENQARWNHRPVRKIHNEFSSTVVEHTSKDDFEQYGDHRHKLVDAYYYNHNELMFDQIADAMFTDEWLQTLQATSGEIDLEEKPGREKWIKDNESSINEVVRYEMQCF